jgi:arylsulfatase A-like enzyme
MPSGKGFAPASAGVAICRQTAAGGALLTMYGLWVATGRLPGGLPIGTRVVSSLWAVAIFAALGMIVAGLIAAIAMAAAPALQKLWQVLRSLATIVILRLARYLARRQENRFFAAISTTLLRIAQRPGRAPIQTYQRIRIAAVLETCAIIPLVLWLTLNEFTYSMTSQVIGMDALRMIWSIPGAIFENAWEMGGRYLIAAGVLTIAAGIATCRLSARSMMTRQAAPELPNARSTRTAATARIAGSMSGGLVLLAVLLVLQFQTKPGIALTTVFKSAPPLRAFNLAQAAMGLDLATTPPASFGDPLVGDAAWQASMGKPRQPAPNVVLILLESVSASALHCYGHPRADITPNMDTLAAEGTLFEHCVSPASFSTYSVVSIMTSLYMLRASHNDHFSDASFPFLGLPRMLKLAGYELAIFSSGNEAFDRISHFTPPSDFDTYFSHDTWGQQKSDCMRMEDTHAVGHFEKWLAARTDPRPFYVSFYLQSTHFNYEVPEPWFSHYKPVPPLYSNGDGIIHIPADVVPLLKNQYDNSMRYSDYWVGCIRQALAKAGALDNSIIVIVGDHGEAFMQHGLARHGVHLWEEMIHVPLITWVGPTLRKSLPDPLPSRVADSVSSIDIAPTVANLVGVRPYPGWQGVDVLASGYNGRERPVYCVLQLTQWMESVCLDKWKYIYNLTDVEKSLYDLNTDPDERNNLIESEPGRAAALHAMLAGWHTYQTTYYDRQPFEQYVGRYQPSTELLTAFNDRGKPESKQQRPLAGME